jgi:pimeloyl-ACP methyl ester carboxylesterase
MTSVTFQRVALASQTIEALTAQPEAYSFSNIDALIITSWADQAPQQALLTQSQQVETSCAAGGDPAKPGYVFVPLSASDYQSDYFFNAEPAVVSAAVAMRSRTPCGETESAGQAIAADQAGLRTITAPVLLVYGINDVLWSQPSSGNGQASDYSGARSVTTVFLDNTGNGIALERTAPQFRSAVSTWLCANFEQSCPLAGSVPEALSVPALPLAGLAICGIGLLIRNRRRRVRVRQA